MFSLITSVSEIESELYNIVRLFSDEYDSRHYTVAFNLKDTEASVEINDQIFTFLMPKNPRSYKLFVRECKKGLYKALSAFFNRAVPWGALTGIRPTKLVYEYLAEGNRFEKAPEYLQNEFFVTEEKSLLVSEIVRNQREYLSKNPQEICLYVHIPFCPSRCKYCSFVSQPATKQQKIIPPYVDRLCEEIEFSLKLISKNNQKIHSIYIGGGTPTVLSDSLFEKVLKTICTGAARYYVHPALEITCEAGRPETITPAKISIMKSCGVTRVSVNPQSLNPETLSAIGRGHTVGDFYRAFELVKQEDFSVNVDLIAGLENESFSDFSKTLESTAKLRPDNITVHTLSRKRGSMIKEEMTTDFATCVSAMMEFAQSYLVDKGYLPYYLYRQKSQLENLENVGYCLPDTQCVNNIAVMEEALSAMACGAGAISKRVFYPQNRIERFANIKDPALYLERFDQQLQKKEKFFH